MPVTVKSMSIRSSEILFHYLWELKRKCIQHSLRTTEADKIKFVLMAAYAFMRKLNEKISQNERRLKHDTTIATASIKSSLISELTGILINNEQCQKGAIKNSYDDNIYILLYNPNHMCSWWYNEDTKCYLQSVRSTS